MYRPEDDSNLDTQPQITQQQCSPLPLEIWTYILYIYCGRFWVPPEYFNRSREELRRKNAGWMRLIDQDSLFWCRVVVDRAVSVLSLQRHVANIRGRNIDVSINLDHLGFNHGPGFCEPQLPRYRRARDKLAVIIQTVYLWRHVGIVATCVTYMQLIVDAIRHTPAPSLLSLSFCCHTYSHEEFSHAFFSPPPRLFNGFTPRLLNLRLVGTVLPWGSEPMFSSLTKLVIANVPVLDWPTSSAFISTLTAATSLHTIIIRNFGVHFPPDAMEIHPFMLPSLRTLELIRSSGTNSILSTLRAASTPCLGSLILHGFNGPEYQTVTSSLQHCAQVRELFVRTSFCAEATVGDISVMLRAVPQLRHLDVTINGQIFIDALAANPELVSRLSRLALGDADLCTAHDYVMKRANYRTSPLDLYFVGDDGITEDQNLDMIREMRDRLGNFETFPVFPRSI